MEESPTNGGLEVRFNTGLAQLPLPESRHDIDSSKYVWGSI